MQHGHSGAGPHYHGSPWWMALIAISAIFCLSKELRKNGWIFIYFQVLGYCPKDMKADICVHLNRKVGGRSSDNTDIQMQLFRFSTSTQLSDSPVTAVSELWRCTSQWLTGQPWRLELAKMIESNQLMHSHSDVTRTCCQAQCHVVTLSIMKAWDGCLSVYLPDLLF